jgi:hypothetical protein
VTALSRNAITRRTWVQLCLGVVLAVAFPAPSARAVAEPAQERCTVTAAQVHGWGNPTAASEFGSAGALDGWTIYNDVGHEGNGRRTPAAVKVNDGTLTITGDPAGNSAGMAWWPGRQFGRWEVCAKAPAGSADYHPVLLLWPDSNNWPADGEIDFMEIMDPTRQVVTATSHHIVPFDPTTTWGPEDQASIAIDATRWHSWAVDWAPGRITGFVDGVQWFEVTSNVPTASMHLCIQLDNFGGDISQGGQLLVNWARQYPGS